MCLLIFNNNSPRRRTQVAVALISIARKILQAVYCRQLLEKCYYLKLALMIF